MLDWQLLKADAMSVFSAWGEALYISLAFYFGVLPLPRSYKHTKKVMNQGSSTRLNFFALNSRQISQWDMQKISSSIKYVSPPNISLYSDGKCNQETILYPDNTTKKHTQLAPSAHTSLEPSLVTNALGASPSQQTCGLNNSSCGQYAGVSDGRHFMTICPYDGETASINLQSSGTLDNSVCSSTMYEYTCTIAQRFVDVSVPPLALGLSSSGYKSYHLPQSQGATRDYIFKPISDAMYISNYDEQLLNISSDHAPSGPTSIVSSEGDDATLLFQITSPSVDVAVSATATEALPCQTSDVPLDPLMLSAFGATTVLDANSAYEFVDLLRSEPTLNQDMPISAAYTPHSTSPTIENRKQHQHPLTLMTPTHLYIPKQNKYRASNIPDEIQLKKRLFHARRMIRIIINMSQRIESTSSTDNVYGIPGTYNNQGVSLDNNEAFEAYQIVPVRNQSNDILHQDAFILYCGDGMSDETREQNLMTNSVLSPLKVSHMSPLAPFTLNISGEMAYRSIKFNRDAIQSPIIRNNVLTATPKIVILPDSSNSTQSRRFIVTPIHPSTPCREIASGFKNLNYHALSSNEPSNEKGAGDIISDQSYDSLFIDIHKQTRVSGSSVTTPYAFSRDRSKKDFKGIPLPPTLKKS